MKGAVSEKGECDGLLSIHIEAEFVGALNLEAGQELAEAPRPIDDYGPPRPRRSDGQWPFFLSRSV